jgi:hypothetical protein
MMTLGVVATYVEKKGFVGIDLFDNISHLSMNELWARDWLVLLIRRLQNLV